jgi:hypothetical protein
MGTDLAFLIEEEVNVPENLIKESTHLLSDLVDIITAYVTIWQLNTNLCFPTYRQRSFFDALICHPETINRKIPETLDLTSYSYVPDTDENGDDANEPTTPNDCGSCPFYFTKLLDQTSGHNTVTYFNLDELEWFDVHWLNNSIIWKEYLEEYVEIWNKYLKIHPNILNLRFVCYFFS